MDAAARYGLHCMPYLREDACLTSEARETQLRELLLPVRGPSGPGRVEGRR